MASVDSAAPSAKTIGADSQPEIKTKAGWKDFLAISKTGIVVSNLMTTFTGLWLALHFTGLGFVAHLDVVLWTLLGTTGIIAGGCAFNNYIDRDIDPIMERTCARPSATGHLSGKQILWYATVMSGLGMIFLLMTGSLAATGYGLLGLFVYVVIYSKWLKRTHSLNTVVGSISGALPPLIGWAAIDPGLSQTAWLLFAVMFLWQPPHFLALAMKRVKEYRAAGIPMLPVVAGFAVTKRQINTYIVALIGVSLLLYPLGPVYLIVTGLLGLGWLGVGLFAKRFKDDVIWARVMFVYSLNYLTVIFLLMIAVTLF